MAQYQDKLNRYLVELFNDVLKAEELSLIKEYGNLSLKEFHVIEAVCLANDNNGDNSTASIAEALKITAGSLTVAVNTLEKKGYLVRKKIDKDKRIVRIYPTELGLEVNRYHEKFHYEMVGSILSIINEDEADILLKALEDIRTFFNNKYIQNKETL